MKWNKYLMLGLAGLAFAACSNEEELIQGQNLGENGSVTVKIVSPETRTVAGSADGTILVGKNETIYVKLTATEGGDTKEIVADGSTHTVKFYGVKNPTQVEAWINNGDEKGLGTTDIAQLQMVPTEIPAYGSTTSINLSGKTETVGEGDEKKTYEMYEASVEMKIPVARLEVSGIKHATHPVGDETTCKYATLTIDGIYLDKVKSTAAGEPVDYAMPAGEDGTPAYPILSEEIESASFLTPDAVWPAVEGQVYAFNFYTGAMPILKIYFKNATAANDDDILAHPRYAVIKSYNGDENFDFKPGYVYRIKDVTLKDANIIGDEEGNTYYGVDVTVTEAKWTVVDITGEWVEE